MFIYVALLSQASISNTTSCPVYPACHKSRLKRCRVGEPPRSHLRLGDCQSNGGLEELLVNSKICRQVENQAKSCLQCIITFPVLSMDSDLNLKTFEARQTLFVTFFRQLLSSAWLVCMDEYQDQEFPQQKTTLWWNDKCYLLQLLKVLMLWLIMISIYSIRRDSIAMMGKISALQCLIKWASLGLLCETNITTS